MKRQEHCDMIVLCSYVNNKYMYITIHFYRTMSNIQKISTSFRKENLSIVI